MKELSARKNKERAHMRAALSMSASNARAFKYHTGL